MAGNPKTVMDEAMARIRFDKDRQAIIECGCKGRTFVSLAKELGVTPATVRVHYWRGIRFMRGKRSWYEPVQELCDAAEHFFFDRMAKDLKPWVSEKHEKTEEEIIQSQKGQEAHRYMLAQINVMSRDD